MSVLARDRSVSKLEFYHTALKLRKSLYFLAMRDFGTKDKVLTPTGRIIRGIPRDVVVRERRKLKHLAELVCEGKLTRKEFCSQYKGWRGDKTRYDAHGIIVQMDNLYHDLLGGIENGRE